MLSLGYTARYLPVNISVMNPFAEHGAAGHKILDKELTNLGLPRPILNYERRRAKAVSKAIRRTFGAHTPIHRYQIHKPGCPTSWMHRCAERSGALAAVGAR